ncbi:hypothetical protein [Pectinatus frisingensis]|uniref:hypothetical protein n=1 Tax=Pectinatus frisingensis TaxID=865 RepID=UPI0018C6DFFF|nr:hypothetical protein [Pectinatus frisingensis]
MTQKIFQLENNEILITDGQSTYTDSKENFLKDIPSFDSFSNNLVIYNQTLKVYVTDDKINDYTAQPNFDTCIDSVQTIIDVQKKRKSDATT